MIAVRFGSVIPLLVAFSWCDGSDDSGARSDNIAPTLGDAADSSRLETAARRRPARTASRGAVPGWRDPPPTLTGRIHRRRASPPCTWEALVACRVRSWSSGRADLAGSIANVGESSSSARRIHGGGGGPSGLSGCSGRTLWTIR